MYELVAVKALRRRKKWNNPGIMIIYYKDKVKHVKFIENPTILFRTTKLEALDKYASEKILVTIEEDDTEVIEVAYPEIYDEIVRLQNDFDPEGAARNLAYLESCRRNKITPDNLLLLTHVHGIDCNIEDHYMGRFLEKYEDQLDHGNIRKGYFDIEANSRGVRRFVPAEEHSIPVNAISYFDVHTRTLKIRLLDNSGPKEQYVEFNQGIEDFKANLENERKSIEKHINEQQASLFSKKPLPYVKVVINFFSDEAELISDFYQDLKKLGTDYLMAWNQEYDINMTLSRLRDLKSYEYCCDIVSDDSVPVDYRAAYYRGDFKAKDISKKNDNWSISSPWECLDQQYLFFKIRESMSKPEETNLDYALSTELGIHKVSYDGEIYDFHYDDYSRFVLYSAIDSMGLFWLDTKTADIDTIIMFGNLSHTRFQKTMTKTVMLRNFIEYFFRKEEHLIVSNNRVRILNKLQKAEESKGKVVERYPELLVYNTEYTGSENTIDKTYAAFLEEDDEDTSEEEIEVLEKALKTTKKKTKFRGAFVADPKLMSPYGVDILGSPSSLIFDLVADSDLSSLYPNLKIAWNIYLDTMIGKIYPRSNVKDINFSAELYDYIISRDHIAIGNKYLGLPNQTELLALFEDSTLA